MQGVVRGEGIARELMSGVVRRIAIEEHQRASKSPTHRFPGASPLLSEDPSRGADLHALLRFFVPHSLDDLGNAAYNLISDDFV